MKFIKLPVEVEAFQVTQEYLNQMRDPKRFLPEKSTDSDGTECISITTMYTTEKNCLRFNIWEDKVMMSVRTLEGLMSVSVGDWIITGVKGEMYPCKPDIFEQTYKRVK